MYALVSGFVFPSPLNLPDSVRSGPGYEDLKKPLSVLVRSAGLDPPSSTPAPSDGETPELAEAIQHFSRAK